jgi:putative membrane protein
VRLNKLILAFPILFISVPIYGQPASAVNLSRSESSFLKDAAAGGIAEVKFGELAEQNAASERVRNFGKQMVKDHTKMGDEVRSLASTKSVDLPTDMGVKEKVSYKLLSSKKGSDFDRQYVEAMVKDHQNDIAEFEKESTAGKDPDVKALAAKALPTLRKHLQMAEDVAREIGASTK